MFYSGEGPENYQFDSERELKELDKKASLVKYVGPGTYSDSLSGIKFFRNRVVEVTEEEADRLTRVKNGSIFKRL